MNLARSLAGLAFGAALVAAAAPANAQTSAAPQPFQYFPMPAASRWIEWDYVVLPQGSAAIPPRPAKIRADRLTSANPRVRRARFSSYLDATVATLVRDGSGKVSEVDGPPPVLRPWYDFGAAPGAWLATEIERASLPGVAVDVENDAGTCAVTPAGVFEDCLTVRYSTGAIRNTGLLSETFAPGVGLVSRSHYAPFGTFETRLTNFRTSRGFSLVGRRPLDATLSVDPQTIVIGGAAPPPGAPPPHHVIHATLHLSSPAHPIVAHEGPAPVAFFAVSGDRLLAKESATPLSSTGVIRVDAAGVDYSVTFDLTGEPSQIAAQTDLVPGAPVQTADIKIVCAP
jgi:hypothetical protein